MKFKRWAAVFMIAAVSIIYVVYQDYLPPQTPQKRARLISELKIPRNAEVVIYQDDDAAPISDWRLLIVLQLTQSQYNELTVHLTSEWKPLNEDVWKRFHLSKEQFRLHNDVGIYNLSRVDESEFGDLTELTISILSPIDRRVVVYSYSL